MQTIISGWVSMEGSEHFRYNSPSENRAVAQRGFSKRKTVPGKNKIKNKTTATLPPQKQNSRL